MARHWSETIAKQYLEEQGYSILKENYAIRGGEIDLIVKKNEVIIFIEVRQRSSINFGTAAESLSATKLNRIRKTAIHYLVKTFGHTDVAMRFDAVLLSGSKSSYTLEHLSNILF